MDEKFDIVQIENSQCDLISQNKQHSFSHGLNFPTTFPNWIGGNELMSIVADF